MNKKEIERIFKEEEKEIKTWVYYGFIGGHHWGNRNYIPIFMFPVLICTFIFFSVLFGIDLFHNIMNISSGNQDVLSGLNSGDLVSNAAIIKVIPVTYGLIALGAITMNISWWMYDLTQIELKYKKRKDIFFKIKNNSGIKSVFVTYLLCMLLGTLGAHRFYINKPVSAVIMFFLSMSSFLIITGLVLIIWFVYDSLNIYKVVVNDNKNKYLNQM